MKTKGETCPGGSSRKASIACEAGVAVCSQAGGSCQARDSRKACPHTQDCQFCRDKKSADAASNWRGSLRKSRAPSESQETVVLC